MQNEALPDRFVVCGESYKDLRELLAEIVIGKDVNALTEKVEVNFICFQSNPIQSIFISGIKPIEQ